MSSEMVKNEIKTQDSTNNNKNVDILNSSIENYSYKDTLPLIQSDTNHNNKGNNENNLTTSETNQCRTIIYVNEICANKNDQLNTCNVNSNNNILTQINEGILNSSLVKNDFNLTDNNSNDDSLNSNLTNSTLMCRICHCEETSEEYLITPCYCSGTLKYVHQSCLQQWLKSNGMKSCELCKFEFIMQTKIRPFKNWEKLDMNNIERRKILCSVTFHLIAITCVIWSLYVLIDRTAEEVKNSNFDWAFWTKVVVVAIGFTGGVVFMYIQCKMYFQLCLRWRQYNRVIIIQPITEEILKNSKKKSHEKNNGNNCASSFILSLKNSNSKSNNTNNHNSHNNVNVIIEENPLLLTNTNFISNSQNNNQTVINFSSDAHI